MTDQEKAEDKLNFRIGDNSGAHLTSFFERIERLEEEKSVIADDIKEIFSEAKAMGFDTKIMRQVLVLRRMDEGTRQEREALLDLYMTALGMKK